MMKRSRAFILATLMSLLPLLMLIPLFVILVLFRIGLDVTWLTETLHTATIIHSSIGFVFSGIALLLIVIGLPIALLNMFLTLIFFFISKKFGKLVIPAYLFAALSILSVGGLFLSILGMLFLRSALECAMNGVYMGVPVIRNEYNYLFSYYYHSYKYLAKCIIEVVFNGLLIPTYLLTSTIVLVPSILFLLSIALGFSGKKQVE